MRSIKLSEEESSEFPDNPYRAHVDESRAGLEACWEIRGRCIGPAQGVKQHTHRVSDPLLSVPAQRLRKSERHRRRTAAPRTWWM
jgi:hypothetical protein